MPAVSLTSSLLHQFSEAASVLGFDLCSASPAQISSLDEKSYLTWCENGFAAGMHYMDKEPRKRLDIGTTFPGTKTVLSLGVSYYQGELPNKPGIGFGRVARYAWGLDYHDVILTRLEKFMDEVRVLIGSEVKSTLAVDSKPLLERALARSASLGFTGKNTLLIVPRSARFHMGSWIFLSEVLLDIPYEGDPGPDILDGCGSCTKCLTACPTGAFEGPYRLRADSCISYLTIENKGGIPFEFREKLGDWIFGCDICQDVCPFNARAFETRWPEFSADRGAGPWMSLSEILAIPDQSSFKAQWGQTPLARAKRKGLVRNACVAAGNSKDESLLPFLDALLSDEESLVRGHALWALSKIRPGEKTRLAADRLWKNDSDEGVRRECEVVLQ